MRDLPLYAPPQVRSNMKYEILTSEPAPKRVQIPVRQLGIGKFVYVRSK